MGLAQWTRAEFERQPEQARDAGNEYVRQQKIAEPFVAGEDDSPPERDRRVQQETGDVEIPAPECLPVQDGRKCGQSEQRPDGPPGRTKFVGDGPPAQKHGDRAACHGELPAARIPPTA